MTDSDTFDEFERLWGSYRVCSDAAAQLATPSFEDDEIMRMAIVGFSYQQKTEEWHREHWKLAQENLAECDHLKDTSKTKKFAMLALGALLGLYSAGKIDDRVYRLGYILLPGFIMGKGGAVEAL